MSAASIFERAGGLLGSIMLAVGNYLRAKLLVVTAVALIGCSTDDSVADVTVPQTTARIVSVSDVVTTTAADSITPETTTAATTVPTSLLETTAPASTPATSGEPSAAELTAAIETLLHRNLDTWSDPPNADVLSFCAEGSTCATNIQAGVDEFVASGFRVINQPVEKIVSIDSVRDLGDGGQFKTGIAYKVTYTVADERDNFGEVVDADGVVQYQLVPDDEYPRTTRTIIRASDEVEMPWRFAD